VKYIGLFVSWARNSKQLSLLATNQYVHIHPYTPGREQIQLPKELFLKHKAIYKVQTPCNPRCDYIITRTIGDVRF
jgi:hypothetical protein